MDNVDCVVIGAGVVGLAVARQLAGTGFKPLLIERHRAIGMETSSRNSEVIHAGLYYTPGSLKARLCLRGRELLYAWCAARGIAHRRCGKLVVAAADQEQELEALVKQAHDNGATEVRALDGGAARALEPELRCAAALYSPASGIVDSHACLLALLGEAEERGATLATSSAVTGLRLGKSGIDLWINGGSEPLLRASRLVNAAGLDAVDLARSIEGFPAAQLPRAHFAKGSYFTLEGRAPFSHLIYPLPQPGGLGVHLTLDLAGRARFGPDVEWLQPGQPFDYAVNPARAASFAAAIRQWWPGLDADRLRPGYAGIRPKLSGPGEPAADFRIEGPQTHGVPGLVNLFGIESPGLTAALAIAERVGELLGV